MRRAFIGALFLVVGIGASALAQNQRLMLSDTIIGSGIRNQEGDKIGSIEQFIVDPATGQNRFVVVDVGGFLGFREREIAVPWDQFRVIDRGTIVANLSKEDVQRAPVFDEDRWKSSMDRAAWEKEVTDYFASLTSSE